MKWTLIVTIGRNIGTTPMKHHEWQAFNDEVAAAIDLCGGQTVLRPCVDCGNTTGYGGWGGVPEDSACHIAIVPDGTQHAAAFKLRNLAFKYGQDAIGYICVPGESNTLSAIPDPDDGRCISGPVVSAV